MTRDPMAHDPVQWSRILASAQSQIRPTSDERRRVHAAMQRELDDMRRDIVDPLSEVFHSHSSTDPGDAQGWSIDLDAPQQHPPQGFDRRGSALAIAALLLAVVGLVTVLRDGPQQHRVDTGSFLDQSQSSGAAAPTARAEAADLEVPNVEPTQTPHPTVAPTPEPAPLALRRGAGIDGHLEPGHYSLQLNGSHVSFELYDERTVSYFGTQSVVLDRVGGSSTGELQRITIAVAPSSFDGGSASSWLDDQSIEFLAYPVMANGKLADDFDLVLDSPNCELATKCLELPLQMADDRALSLIGGPNRMLVQQLDDGSSLVVLDTSAGHRSGATRLAYNILISSLVVTP